VSPVLIKKSSEAQNYNLKKIFVVGRLKIVEILIKVPSFNKTVADFLNFNRFDRVAVVLERI
jgi:hypothetical protein